MTLTSPNDDTLYTLAGAADGSVAANYNLVLSADGTAQNTMVFKQGANVTFTRAANSLTIAATNDNDQYALAGAASTTAGEYDLVLSNDGTDQDTMVFKQGSNITFTRAADLLTITATNTWNANTKTVPGYVAAPGAVANKVWKTDGSGNPDWRDDATGDNTTYTIESGNTKVITLTGSDGNDSTVTFADGNDISISGNNDTITIASTFAEADTLATVTGRGATTTTKSYFNGDLEVNDTITVKRTGSNNGKISIEGNPPLLELKNYDGQTTSDQLLSSIEFYGSDTSGSNVAGVRASINCNTGFDDPTGTSNRNQGCLEFATYNGTDVSNSPLQRLKITPDGGFSFGNTSTAYGTSGQVLQSNGDAPPTWVNGDNFFVTGASYSSGTLTLTRNGGLADLTATGFSQGDVTLTGTQTLTNKTLTTPVIDQISPSAGLVQVDGAGSVDGGIKLMCYAGTHGQTLKSQPHSAGVTNTMLLPAGANSTLVSEATETFQSLTTTGTSGAATLSNAGVLNIPNYADGNDNDYLTGLAFNTSNGVLTATVQNQSDVTVDLDGRYLTSYTLPLAADGTRGGIQIGYTEAGKNYPVELDSEKAYVNVPWTDNNDNTTYSISIPSSTTKLRLTGANPTSTDDVEFVGGGITTVSRTNANKFTITSTEADTLQSVTARGDTTNQRILMNGSGS